MADHRRDRLRSQVQALARGASAEVTLLKLYALDVIERQEDNLDALEVRLDEALSGGALYKPERLSWCSKVEVDRFGIFAEVEVSEVRFKMRYISPGSFLMGSPEDEEGRGKDEGPQHEVVLTEGVWMCNVPCTQALWQEVMGDNPSQFKSSMRPVECVSWHDCQRFLEALSARAPGLEATLPTEAQWEYACRAGTTTSTYAGQLKILGQRNGPILDSIAWYGGNSGVDFELESGVDSSSWPEKQYAHTSAGTRAVGQKDPNAWGLHDMLGNVWEWCADGAREYSEVYQIDPVGPQDGGVGRVFRGGCWGFDAQGVRAASRDWFEPGERSDYLGFRFSRGQK